MDPRNRRPSRHEMEHYCQQLQRLALNDFDRAPRITAHQEHLALNSAPEGPLPHALSTPAPGEDQDHGPLPSPPSWMVRTKRPHAHEIATPADQTVRAPYRTTMDGAEQMLEIWNHYRQRTAPCTSSGLPRQRDGPNGA